MSGLFYRELPPPPDIEAYVISFWEFLVSPEQGAAIDHEIFPDGCFSIFFYSNLRFGITRLGVTPLHTETVKRQVQPGDRLWGMRLSPSAALPLLRLEPRDLPSAPQIVFPDNVRNALSGARSLEDAKPHLAELLVHLIDGRTNVSDQKVAAVVRAIMSSPAETSIERLALSVSLSTRQLQRRFRRASGMTPKQFARIRRIRAAASHLVASERINWADCALETGYSDQAHLGHEFASVTKRSPGSFAEKLKTIKHGTLVQ